MNCVSILYLYSHTLVRTQELSGPSLRKVHSLLSCLVFVQLARHTFRGADKQHVCACCILMSLCDLMRLMFLMFLYIAVLPHIFNILLRSIFVYVRNSVISQNVLLRALRLQVLCVFTCGSSSPFVAPYCVWPNLGDRQQMWWWSTNARQIRKVAPSGVDPSIALKDHNFRIRFCLLEHGLSLRILE